MKKPILTKEQTNYALLVNKFAQNASKQTSQFCNGYLVSVLHYCDACQFNAAQQAEFEKISYLDGIRYYADHERYY